MKRLSETVKIQAPLLAMFFIALAFVLGWLRPFPVAVSPAMRWVGFGLAALGFLLGLAAWMAFRQARQSPARLALMTSGVYRMSRNPIALGFVLMLAGLPLNAGSYWGVALAPAMIVMFNWFVIEPEERLLASRFGEEFKSYRLRVRRWL